ncbi:ROK family protein [Nocardia rhamnosiphila]|uniref:Glucokinase n=1 Tax=Nocardia rhamnosiphila TaxID=426716 RepID=A0ABV2WJC2_9NOCA|nr:ROK family glucokinase [Nocardia rhamnosiphila]
MTTTCAIGLDVGGTKIAGGVIDADGRILHRIQIPSPADKGTDTTLAALLELVDRMRTRHPEVASIGVGAAGMITWPSGRILTAPNNAYRDLPLQDLLGEHTGLPAVVENDANAAAWAEARLGGGAGYRNVVAVTVGTGVGGGLILDGALFRGQSGFGAEIGHLVVDPGGNVRCGCGSVGCLEAHASGTALGRRGREVAATDPAGQLATLAGGADRVTGETVFAAARQGDSTARGLFDELGYWLGAGLAGLVNVFDPQVVIIGGGLVAAGDYLYPPTHNSFRTHVFAGPHRTLPPIIPARLGEDAGLVGAALLAMERQPALAA